MTKIHELQMIYENHVSNGTEQRMHSEIPETGRASGGNLGLGTFFWPGVHRSCFSVWFYELWGGGLVLSI